MNPQVLRISPEILGLRRGPAHPNIGWKMGVSRISPAWSIFIQNRAVPALLLVERKSEPTEYDRL